MTFEECPEPRTFDRGVWAKREVGELRTALSHAIASDTIETRGVRRRVVEGGVGQVLFEGFETRETHIRQKAMWRCGRMRYWCCCTGSGEARY